jgi:hypothetical protein
MPRGLREQSSFANRSSKKQRRPRIRTRRIGAPTPSGAKNAVAERAHLCRIQNRPSEALSFYRECLAREAGAPDLYVLEYAELILEGRLRSEYRAVLKLLHSSFERHQSALGIFRAALFRYAYLQAVLYRELGDLAAAKPFARAPLAVAAAPSHGIRPDLRLAESTASPEQLHQMQSLASGM